MKSSSSKMNVLLVAIYLTITLSTSLSFFLMIRYLNDKPFGRQVITDKLIIGLMLAILFSIIFLSSVIILRELIGPFSELLTWGVLVLQQFLQCFFGWSLLSFQVASFCNVFFIDR